MIRLFLALMLLCSSAMADFQITGTKIGMNGISTACGDAAKAGAAGLVGKTYATKTELDAAVWAGVLSPISCSALTITKNSHGETSGSNWRVIYQYNSSQIELLLPFVGVDACPPGQYHGGLDGRCICDTGADVGDDGKCCPVAGSGGGSPMMWCYVPNMSATNCDSKGANGCNVRCNSVTFQKGTGDNVQVFPKLALGQSCTFTGKKAGAGVGGSTLTNDELHEVDQATKKPEQAQTPAGCLASGQGYVTGSSGTTCVSGGDTGVVDKKTETESSNDNGKGTTTEKTTESTQGPNGTGTETTTSTTHNADGTTTVKTTTTSKNADGTVTKTESSVTKDSGGNVVDSKSNSSNKDGSTFCSENPNSAVCKGFEDTCKDNPGRLGCMDAGEVPNEGALPSKEGGITGISPVALGSVNVCPQGPPLPFGLGNFSFDGICQLAQGIRPIVLAMAWLSAALILIGAFRES